MAVFEQNKLNQIARTRVDKYIIPKKKSSWLDICSSHEQITFVLEKINDKYDFESEL